MGQQGHHFRAPMGDISINIGPPGAHTKILEPSSRGLLVSPTKSGARFGPEARLSLVELGHGRKGSQPLPGFAEVFGPREALPAFKPPESRPALRPLAYRQELHAQQLGRPSPSKLNRSPMKEAGPASAQDVGPSRKRKSDTLDDDRQWPSVVAPRRNQPYVQTRTFRHGTEVAASNAVPSNNNWATANDSEPATRPAVAAQRIVLPPLAPEPIEIPEPTGILASAAWNTYRKKFRTDRDSAASKLLDVSNVILRGEDQDNVPVFDTCDTIRDKIRTFLTHDGMTQAAFLRQLATTYTDGRRLQGAQLNRFMAMNGPASGNTSGIFYAAYVFFEKLRIRDGQPKSQDRLEMERLHKSGFNVLENRTYIYVLKGENPNMDKYGQMLAE